MKMMYFKDEGTPRVSTGSSCMAIIFCKKAGELELQSLFCSFLILDLLNHLNTRVKIRQEMSLGREE